MHFKPVLVYTGSLNANDTSVTLYKPNAVKMRLNSSWTQSDRVGPLFFSFFFLIEFSHNIIILLQTMPLARKSKFMQSFLSK